MLYGKKKGADNERMKRISCCKSNANIFWFVSAIMEFIYFFKYKMARCMLFSLLKYFNAVWYFYSTVQESSEGLPDFNIRYPKSHLEIYLGWLKSNSLS